MTQENGVTNGQRRRFPIHLLAPVFAAGVLVWAVVIWQQGSNGDSRKLNISCFAYRDVNRNAVYDLEDRPYADLRVKLEGPNEDSWGRSNISGFTNFPMALGDDEQPLDRPGQYDFTAVAPDGYLITSGNETQTLLFTELEGSPAGLVVSGTTCIPIGVAPYLNIIGSLGDGIENNSDAVSVTSSWVPAPVEFVDGGYFSAAADVGKWTVNIDGSGTKARTVGLTQYPVYLSSPNEDRDAFEALAEEVIVDFDEFTSSDTLYEVPNGVAGLQWLNWVATHHKLYKGAGYINGTTSAEYVGYNSSGHPAVVWSDEPFDFVGTNLGVAWPEAENSDIVLRAWRGDVLIYVDRVRASTAGPVYVDAEYRRVTRLEMSSDTNWQFVVDDMRFRLP